MHRKSQPCRRGEAGFTLVEVTVAAFVMVVGLLGTLSMLDSANLATASTKAREQGVARCREQWAAEYANGERWERVCIFMGVFVREGLTATSDAIEAVAALGKPVAQLDPFGFLLDLGGDQRERG